MRLHKSELLLFKKWVRKIVRMKFLKYGCNMNSLDENLDSFKIIDCWLLSIVQEMSCNEDFSLKIDLKRNFNFKELNIPYKNKYSTTNTIKNDK